MLESGVADDGVLELELAVSHVEVDFAVPVLVNLSLDGETCAPYAQAVADAVGPFGLAEEDGSVSLYAVVEPDLVAGASLGAEHQDAVLGFSLERVDVNLDTVLIVLCVLLSREHDACCEEACKYEKQFSHSFEVLLWSVVSAQIYKKPRKVVLLDGIILRSRWAARSCGRRYWRCPRSPYRPLHCPGPRHLRGPGPWCRSPANSGP